MPAPDLTLPQAVSLYLQNRAGFYEALLSRLPEDVLRARMTEELQPFAAGSVLARAVEQLPSKPDKALLSALMLKDLLKKNGSGIATARTSISVEDALNNAQHVEVTGVLLFFQLTREADSRRDVFAEELAAREHALACLIRLEDELRYHRLRLTPAR